MRQISEARTDIVGRFGVSGTLVCSMRDAVVGERVSGLEQASCKTKFVAQLRIRFVGAWGSWGKLRSQYSHARHLSDDVSYSNYSAPARPTFLLLGRRNFS